jgi:uncharacterized protein (DUF697 family)
MSDQALVTNDEVQSRVARAMDVVRRNMLWSAGAGVLPMPLLELAAITAVEVKLVKELADHYGTPFRKDIAKTAVVSLIGSLGSVTIGKMIALSGLRAIPVLGQVIAIAAVPGIAAAVTYAIGRVFISHFEAGGTLLDFDPAEMRDYFRAEFANGLKEAAANAGAGSRGRPAPAA